MLGENLKKIRGFNGYTISRLSRESSISEYSIIKIESGKTVDPKRSTLQKLADILGVEVEIFYANDLNISQEARAQQKKLPLISEKSQKKVANV